MVDGGSIWGCDEGTTSQSACVIGNLRTSVGVLGTGAGVLETGVLETGVLKISHGMPRPMICGGTSAKEFSCVVCTASI